MGFSRVIAELIKAKRPLVGHNMFLDMLFVYNQFIADLPPTLGEFTESWLSKFPLTFDTKVLATGLSLFPKTNLQFMAGQFFQAKKFDSLCKFCFSAGFDLYLGHEQLHEAGYDSYLTGVCFCYMLKYIETQNLI